VDVFEVFEGNPPHLMELKRQTRPEFEQGVAFYVEGKFDRAEQVFQQVLQRNEQDRVTQVYINRCKDAQLIGLSELNIVTTKT
jgi:two-component system sensor histidine kinase ChiS